VLNAPTKITWVRIILSIVIIAVLCFPFYSMGINFPRYLVHGVYLDSKYLIAGVIFILACITDFFDGALARKKNQVTDTGKILDSIADKILVDSILIILASDGLISVFIPVVVVLRDIVVDAIKMEAGRKGKVVAAIASGKLKTASLMLGIIFTLFYNLPYEFWNIQVADFLLYFASIMAIFSAIEYYHLNKNLLKNVE